MFEVLPLSFEWLNPPIVKRSWYPNEQHVVDFIIRNLRKRSNYGELLPYTKNELELMGICDAQCSRRHTELFGIRLRRFFILTHTSNVEGLSVKIYHEICAVPFNPSGIIIDNNGWSKQLIGMLARFGIIREFHSLDIITSTQLFFRIGASDEIRNGRE